MAFTVSAYRVSWANTTAETSTTTTPLANFSSGSIAVLFVSADNSATSGATNNINSVTDTLGNVWSKVVSSLCDPGAANAGVQGAVFVTDQSAGLLTTSTTISINFGATTTAKAWAMFEVSVAAGSIAKQLGSGNGSEQTATTLPTVTTGTIGVGDLVFGMVAIEGGGATVTADSDTTNGTWVAGATPWTGTATGGIMLNVSSKIQTTTASTQTYNPTLSVARDLICSWLSIREVTPKRLASAGVG